jgi:hypothetical protein
MRAPAGIVIGRGPATAEGPSPPPHPQAARHHALCGAFSEMQCFGQTLRARAPALLEAIKEQAPAGTGAAVTGQVA